MRSLSTKLAKQRLLSQMAVSIGGKIRQQLIQSKKPSPQKQFSIRRINKIKTEPFNPEEKDKLFWSNPYKTQKHQWDNSAISKPIFGQKQDIGVYKSYQLEKFKHQLRASLQDCNSSKHFQVQLSHSRVKSFRSKLIESRKQKTESMTQKKQRDAEMIRRMLDRKKAEAKIHKRRAELEIEFNRWHRQEQKLLKHRKLLQQETPHESQA